jgi:hypothetical protein
MSRLPSRSAGPSAGCGMLCAVLLLLTPVFWWLFTGRIYARRKPVVSLECEATTFWILIPGAILVVAILCFGFFLFSSKNKRDRF